MVSHSGRFVLTYNGEIYNFPDLRRELEETGYPFRGHSDTEVLLAGIEAWGLEAALQRMRGMFAFAVLDRREGRLHLARDRLGIKPLYYGTVNGAFVFASELRALRRYPGFQARVDAEATALLLQHGYIPAPYSIYQGIRKLPPGHRLSVAIDHPGTVSAPMAFWSLEAIATQAQSDPFRGDTGEAVEGLHRLLHDAVSLRMVADVPLGAFLSGGIDSSLVVALMQEASPRPVKTFTIGFREAEYNEAARARRIAAHLGTDHTEAYLSAEDALKVIPDIPNLFDEPFADSSQIPTFLVSRLARQRVTVALSGDGGDELFCGYLRYLRAMRLWRKLGALPERPRRAAGRAVGRFHRRISQTAAKRLTAGGGGSAWLPVMLRKMNRFGDILSAPGPDALYRQRFVSQWREPRMVVRGLEDVGIGFDPAVGIPPLKCFPDRMMYRDTVSYLPDDILTKVDRVSMAVGLEARVPMLDHHVVEFAWRLPLELKLRNSEGKWVLRQLLGRLLPEDLITGEKKGFSVPLESWLRAPLRDWAEELLDRRHLEQQGYLNPGPVREKWEQHLSGRGAWSHQLWSILMFQAWVAENG